MPVRVGEGPHPKRVISLPVAVKKKIQHLNFLIRFYWGRHLPNMHGYNNLQWGCATELQCTENQDGPKSIRHAISISAIKSNMGAERLMVILFLWQASTTPHCFVLHARVTQNSWHSGATRQIKIKHEAYHPTDHRIHTNYHIAKQNLSNHSALPRVAHMQYGLGTLIFQEIEMGSTRENWSELRPGRRVSRRQPPTSSWAHNIHLVGMERRQKREIPGDPS